MKIIDVTNEFCQATASYGNIQYEKGYNKSFHKEEIQTAKWLIRKAIKQIKTNPGGIILSMKHADDLSKIEKSIATRLERTRFFQIDVLIIMNYSLIKALRYIKKER